MLPRVMGRSICVFAISGTCALAIAACASSPNDSGFDAGAHDASVDAGDPTAVDGAPPLGVLDSGGCTPKTCATLNVNCGMNPDGCGNLLDCGHCSPPDFCGGGGFNRCGTADAGFASDGGNPCSPTTCAAQGINCGPASDGCGGLLNCGSCASPTYCGGGGFSKCGGNNGLAADGGVPCTPLTACPKGQNCGYAGDGCGGVLTCGTCSGGQVCGGGGFNACGTGISADGGNSCTPLTCGQLGYECGQAGDGCGGLLSCGGPCPAPEYCGGGGFDKCGPKGAAGCEGGGVTTLSGYVYDPANNLPVYNALVYVPQGVAPKPQSGVNPPSCGCDAPPAFASAFTAIDGSFTLQGVPSGANVTVVVQLGKWQRTYQEPVTACTANKLSTHLTLPSKHSEGNIPLIAVDTGDVDTMECVLLKMGLDPSEFVDPSISAGLPTAAGRVHLYHGDDEVGQGINGQPDPKGGALIDSNTPPEEALTEAASVLNSYDVVLFPCKGGEAYYDAAHGFPNSLGNLLNYANSGGRVFATHYSYVWLFQNGALQNTATWATNTGSWDGPLTGAIDQTFGRGQALTQWLHQASVYGGTLGQIPVSVVREDFTSVTSAAQRWMYASPDSNTTNIPIHYTFDTPVSATKTCGRVVYSDFHVENSTGADGQAFPKECAPGGMTPQEKLLEFMLFDLTSCVNPPACKPLTCADYPSGTCGVQGDGCGGITANCGTCVPPQTCGGGGVDGQCGQLGGCTPKTCAQQGIQCGPAGDGCGNEIMCGPCIPPATCGGAGVNGQCGYPDAATCKPETCAQQNIFCGPAGDGCGNELMCGTCVPPQTCGGGGINGQCGAVDAGTCVPQSCAAQNAQCGQVSDGCGNILLCPGCPQGEQCINNRCINTP